MSTLRAWVARIPKRATTMPMPFTMMVRVITSAALLVVATTRMHATSILTLPSMTVRVITQSCLGCTDEGAANYDPTATVDDNSCEFPGCVFPAACNYDATANTNDGSCEYTSCAGCMNASACNFDPEATISDFATCEFAEEGYDCSGACLNDADGDGICDEFEVTQGAQMQQRTTQQRCYRRRWIVRIPCARMYHPSSV